MIDDEVLRGRIPRLGTISTGWGEEATSQAGHTYSRPHRADSLVVHTHDGEVANAVQLLLGGSVHTDSPVWAYDVVTDSREAQLTALPQGFRQALELWRAAECQRRCDGVRMNTRDGRPTDEACACADEMDRGHDRACEPSTILPVLLPLDVERFGVFEVRSNSWGTANALKGAMKALAMIGSTATQVPAMLTMVDRQVRDNEGRLRDVSELHLTIAASLGQLGALESGAAPQELSAPSDARAALLDELGVLHHRAAEAGYRDRLAHAWTQRHGEGATFDDLSDDALAEWVTLVRGTVSEAA